MYKKFKVNIFSVILSFIMLTSFLITSTTNSLVAKASDSSEDQYSYVDDLQLKEAEQELGPKQFSAVNNATENANASILDKYDNENICSEIMYSEFDERPYALFDTATLQFHVETLSEINDINYESVGFSISSLSTDNNIITINLGFEPSITYAHFKLIVTLLNENTLVANIYGYKVENVYYLSRASQTDGYELKYDYELNNNLSHYKNIETTLQNTLVMAQTTAEEVKNVAKQQADQIIEEAKKQADEIVKNSKSSARKTLDDLDMQISAKEKAFDDLKKQFDIYKAKMESLLMSQAELLKEINKDDF